jgi:hypothetical protein
MLQLTTSREESSSGDASRHSSLRTPKRAFSFAFKRREPCRLIEEAHRQRVRIFILASLRPQRQCHDETLGTSFTAVDSTPPLQHLAILKPLVESAGGLDHVGGDVWSDVNDPGYICVLACLEGRVSDEQAACAEARSSVMLPPKL